MFDNLNSQIVESSDIDILSAFGDDDGEDTGTGKKTDTKRKVESKTDSKKSSASKEKPVLGSQKVTTPEFSEDEIDEAFGDDDEEEVSIDKSKGKKGFKPITTESDTNEDETESDEDETDEEDTDENEDKNSDDDDSDNDESAVKDFLKTRAEYLIKKGEWADFEGREDMEWDEDTFAEIELQQRQYQKQGMREEILDSFGPYGREIAEFASNGGDPDQLIDIFKEQQRVEGLSIETEEDQRAVVLKYETEFLNKKPERVKKYIDSLIADKELATYAQEAKEAMEESLVTEAKQLQLEQQAKIKQAQDRQVQSIRQFQKDISGLINSDNNISVDEKKQLMTVLTKFDKKLKNGTPVNEAYFILDRVRRDLPSYLKLIRFALNPEKYEKGIEQSSKSKQAEKDFKLARTGLKSKKAKASEGFGDTKLKTRFKLL